MATHEIDAGSSQARRAPGKRRGGQMSLFEEVVDVEAVAERLGPRELAALERDVREGLLRSSAFYRDLDPALFDSAARKFLAIRLEKIGRERGIFLRAEM